MGITKDDPGSLSLQSAMKIKKMTALRELTFKKFMRWMELFLKMIQ
jgi:hypothetical protein